MPLKLLGLHTSAFFHPIILKCTRRFCAGAKLKKEQKTLKYERRKAYIHVSPSVSFHHARRCFMCFILMSFDLFLLFDLCYFLFICGILGVKPSGPCHRLRLPDDPGDAFSAPASRLIMSLILHKFA